MKNNIKKARELKKMTQKECADTLGVTLRAWQTYEQGVSEPKHEILCKIADMFDESLDYLLGREPKETVPDPFADIGLDENTEAEMWELYKKFPPEARAMCMDMLVKLGDIARKKQAEQQPGITQTTTAGGLQDLRAKRQQDSDDSEEDNDRYA